MLGGNLVLTRPDAQDGYRPDFVESVFYDDDGMQPLQLEVRQRLSDETTTVTVIGVLAREHEASFSMLASKALLDDLFPFAIPVTRYRFSVARWRGRGASRLQPGGGLPGARHGNQRAGG